PSDIYTLSLHDALPILDGYRMIHRCWSDCSNDGNASWLTWVSENLSYWMSPQRHYTCGQKARASYSRGLSVTSLRVTTPTMRSSDRKSTRLNSSHRTIS